MFARILAPGHGLLDSFDRRLHAQVDLAAEIGYAFEVYKETMQRSHAVLDLADQLLNDELLHPNGDSSIDVGDALWVVGSVAGGIASAGGTWVAQLGWIVDVAGGIVTGLGEANEPSPGEERHIYGQFTSPWEFMPSAIEQHQKVRTKAVDQIEVVDSHLRGDLSELASVEPRFVPGPQDLVPGLRMDITYRVCNAVSGTRNGESEMGTWGRWERAAGVAIVALGLLSGLGLGAAAGDAAAQSEARRAVAVSVG